MTKTMEQPADDLALQVMGYHQATKHHFYRYARALGYMDWANQPNPFRRYEAARLLRLPLVGSDDQPVSPTYDAIYQATRAMAVPVQPVTLTTLSRFLEYALALSAWKQAGDTRWALRMNPSSGNLHPTEGYLLLDNIPGLAEGPGVYHYAPKEHGLERRAEWPSDLFATIMRAFPSEAFLFGLTSIHWRESWKYGERAFRYCQHDVGHAIGSARIAAATLGWKMVLLDDVSDDDIVTLLGIGRDGDYPQAEREHPDCLAVVWPGHAEGVASLPLMIESDAIQQVDRVIWHGTANRLSREKPDPWEIIDVVAAASWKPRTGPRTAELGMGTSASSDRSLPEPDERHEKRPSAGHIIRQRRSALAFDGKTSTSAARFFLMLRRVMPGCERALQHRPMPWDAIPWSPAIHLALFVHRVDGLPQGLYVLVRDPAKLADLREAMHSHFLWARPPGCPDDLPLYCLQEGDAGQLATQVSCHQEIAGAGAFSLGMIAEFESTIRRYGPWFYRRLFWETGVIGQVLYLEAEAAGVRATGIGCFFDDPVHQVFGFQDTKFQSLYHFTVGGPVDDPRLTTLPAYGD
ncbi:MAG TPA: SagB/ThcOx family dehydrogenase [Nitrospiraceae bacterium]|nr:SagB/ThcOx family dehydrogenase [Nitrospiraceae bacterium]